MFSTVILYICIGIKEAKVSSYCSNSYLYSNRGAGSLFNQSTFSHLLHLLTNGIQWWGCFLCQTYWRVWILNLWVLCTWLLQEPGWNLLSYQPKLNIKLLVHNILSVNTCWWHTEKIERGKIIAENERNMITFQWIWWKKLFNNHKTI